MYAARSPSSRAPMRAQRARDRRAVPARLRARRARARRELAEARRAPRRRRASTSTSTSRVSASAAAAADVSPTASSSRGNSVRNASWSNRSLHLLAVPRRPGGGQPGSTSSVDVAHEQRHLAVEEHPVAGLAQVLALLRGQLVEVLEDPLEVAVGGDELGRGLLADARAHPAGCRSGRRGARRTRGTAPAVTPVRSTMPGLVVEHVVGDAAAVVEHLDVRICRRAGSCRGRR